MICGKCNTSTVLSELQIITKVQIHFLTLKIVLYVFHFVQEMYIYVEAAVICLMRQKYPYLVSTYLSVNIKNSKCTSAKY